MRNLPRFESPSLTFLYTHTHTHMQPRNDHHFDGDNLSSCLKVQPLSSTAASSSSSTKSHRSNSTTKSSKAKPPKAEKSPRVPSIAVHHHPFGTELCSPQLITSLPEPPSDYYHQYGSHSRHLAPLSPRSMQLHDSPSMIPSQSDSASTVLAHSAPTVLPYQLQSPKIGQLSPGSAAFPSNQASSHSGPPPIYTSDPASPMQVAYSPNSQPLVQMTSSADMYHDSLLNGHNVISVAFTAAGQAANMGLHHHHHHPHPPPPPQHPPHFLPPPNYTEAVALNNGIPQHRTQTFDHLPTGYDPNVTTCTVGGDYQSTPTLPAGMLSLTSNHF